MDLYKILKELNIAYDEIEHEEIYTIEEALQIECSLDGVGTKNLFLKDKSGRYFLYVLDENKRADLKKLGSYLNALKLSFCKEDDLFNLLGLSKGGVTPLGIINDKDNKVVVVFDEELVGKQLLCHPNVVTKTMSISYEDLIKLIEYNNHKYIIYKEENI
jgi:Ala-tRNA(Pro) deacylase